MEWNWEEMGSWEAVLGVGTEREDKWKEVAGEAEEGDEVSRRGREGQVLRDGENRVGPSGGQ